MFSIKKLLIAVGLTSSFISGHIIVCASNTATRVLDGQVSVNDFAKVFDKLGIVMRPGSTNLPVIVAAVRSGSAAEKRGILKGDTILGVQQQGGGVQLIIKHNSGKIYNATINGQQPLSTPTNAMEAGIAAFNKKDYRSALANFTAALKANPDNANALYYEAVTFHRMKELLAAKEAYATVVTRYPGTDAARNAEAALNYLNPDYLKQFQHQVAMAANNGTRVGQNANGTVNDSISNLPDEVSIPYRREGNNLVISAFINNHPLEMYFDSGAEITMVRKSQLQNLGLGGPQGAPTFLSYGVGDGGGQGNWMIRTNIKVGQIEHRNFPLAVQDDQGGSSKGPAYPLLGETFFRGFSYKVMPTSDENRGSIIFQKKRANSGMASDGGSVPYRDAGRNMIVVVEVNGRSMPMIFDTGASTCCFSAHQWIDLLKMPIPDDAANTMNSGIAGSTRSKSFTADTMRLGGVVKHDVPISVVESSQMPYPLLGNSFFGDLHIEVDNAAHMIRLRK